jgi:hypothetical protein
VYGLAKMMQPYDANDWNVWSVRPSLLEIFAWGKRLGSRELAQHFRTMIDEYFIFLSLSMLSIALSSPFPFHSESHRTHVSSMLPSPQIQKCPVLCIFKQSFSTPQDSAPLSRYFTSKHMCGPVGTGPSHGVLPRTRQTYPRHPRHPDLYMCCTVRAELFHDALPKTRQTYLPHPQGQGSCHAQSSTTDQRSCIVLETQCAS